MNTAPLLPVTIPVGWCRSQLSDHLIEPIRNGFSPVCPEHFTGEWVLSLASVGSDGYNPQGAKPAPVGDTRVAASRLAIGDLLVSRSNTPERVGLAGIYDGDPAPASYPDLLMRVRVGPTINQRLLLEQLLSPKGRSYFAATARGSSGSMVKIDRAILEAFPIFAPHAEEEQRLIADALSDASALIDSLEQLLTKKRQIKQGAMQELLTGKRRLPGFTGEWMTTSLGQIAKVKTGAMNNQDKVEDGEYPFFVRSQSVERIHTFTHDCEAILVPGEGGIGSIFHYIHGRFALHQRVYGITDFSDAALSRFLYFFMRVFFGAHAMENSVKATVDSLRLPTFLDFEVRLPPTKNEQVAIVEVLSDLESEIESLESRLTKARALKQAMAQALLTGRIRLLAEGSAA